MTPWKPPYTEWVGAHDATVVVEDLSLDFVAEVADRQAMLLELDLRIDAGVDIVLEDSTGEVAIDVAMGPEELTATVIQNEFAPEASTDIENNFTDVFDMLAGSLLGDSLSGASFSMAEMDGLGVVNLEFGAAGTNSDWLGGYGTTGEVEYTTEGGCSEGCSGGCSTKRQGGGILMLLLPLFAIVNARKRREN